MNDENRKMTLQERWEIDIEMSKKEGGFIISIPQCESCEYFILGNAKNCIQYSPPNQKPIYVLCVEKECPKFKHKNLMKIFPKTKCDNRLFGGILGFCIGDALGVPVEFTSREERKKDPVHEMRAYGTFHQHFGTWSDDTSMTLCLMESLKKGYNLKDIANTFCKFYYEKRWTPYNKVFDIGNTTARAIERMKNGTDPVKSGGSLESDNGNGSLMRVLPLAFYLCHTEVTQKIKMIEEISSLTHSHKRSKLACIFYVEMAINLFNHNKLDAYKNTVKFINTHCTQKYHCEFSHFYRILNNDISLIEEKNIHSSGYVIDSLESALWSFLTTNNYEESIFKAINLGGDTDTIAALTGGLSGIFYGLNSIPNNWIQCLARKEDIYKLIREFQAGL